MDYAVSACNSYSHPCHTWGCARTDASPVSVFRLLPVILMHFPSLSSFYHFITARLRIKKQFLLYIKDKSIHLILPIWYIHLEAGLITTCFCEWTLVSKLVKVFPRTEIIPLVKMLKNIHTLHFNVRYRKRWCAGELFHLERSHGAFCSAQKHRRWQRLHFNPSSMRHSLSRSFL